MQVISVDSPTETPEVVVSGSDQDGASTSDDALMPVSKRSTASQLIARHKVPF